MKFLTVKLQDVYTPLPEDNEASKPAETPAEESVGDEIPVEDDIATTEDITTENDVTEETFEVEEAATEEEAEEADK